MKQEMYISIPQPCYQNWDAMTPQDKGRFCASCAKTVVDFSQMSDSQVLNYLSQTTGRVCGRFAANQLERPLIPSKKTKKKIWWLAALMPLTLLLNKANGQLTSKHRINGVEYDFFHRPMGLVAAGRKQVKDTAQITHSKLITGTVVDSNNTPVPNVSVVLKGTTIGAATDSMGKFALSFSMRDSLATLEISAIGFDTKEKSFFISDSDEIHAGTIYLESSDNYIGGMVVVTGYAVRRCPKKPTDTLKTNIRKFFNANPFKVYPNPVNRGAAIQIEVKKEGQYSIQLLDAQSKLVSHQIFDAENGGLQTSLSIPASTAAGIYFIRLINDDTKQQYTDKIVIQ